MPQPCLWRRAGCACALRSIIVCRQPNSGGFHMQYMRFFHIGHSNRFFINLSANFILCVCAVLAAQFLAEKLRYISAYLKDSEESQKYDSATGKIFDAIRHSFSRPNIEKIPTISERAMVQPRTPAPPTSQSIPQPPICPQGGT